jgi:hypothetical protein
MARRVLLQWCTRQKQSPSTDTGALRKHLHARPQSTTSCSCHLLRFCSGMHSTLHCRCSCTPHCATATTLPPLSGRTASYATSANGTSPNMAQHFYYTANSQHKHLASYLSTTPRRPPSCAVCHNKDVTAVYAITSKVSLVSQPWYTFLSSSRTLDYSMTKKSAFVTPCRNCGSAPRRSLRYEQKAIWCSDPPDNEPRCATVSLNMMMSKGLGLD